MTPSVERNLNTLIDTNCRIHAARPCVGMALEPPLTYAAFRDFLLQIAGLLQDLGIKSGDRVAIFAENSPAWGASYFAIVRLGAVAVPILPDFQEEDVRHIIADSKVRILFTTCRLIEKVYELNAGSPLERIILLDTCAVKRAPVEHATLSSLLENRPPPNQQILRGLVDSGERVQGSDIASIIYTSGTSGRSKAVMLTHANLCSNVVSAGAVVRIRDDWAFLSILPLSHAYEFTTSFLLPLAHGARIVYAGARPSPAVLAKICAGEKPTAMCVVPLVMEKIYKKRVLPALAGKKLLAYAMRIPAVRKLVFRKAGEKLLDFFGGKLEVLCIGGAALNQEVERFLLDAGFPYMVGYGLTEAAPLISGGPFGDPTLAPGSVGKPVQLVEVRIQNPDPVTGVGEIMVRGPNVMPGYCNNPELTAKSITADGWLATGDLGSLDRHNNLFIRGRSKNIIVLAHGENIYPEDIEDLIGSHRHIAEALVVEEAGRLEGLVYLDYELIDEETRGKSEAERRLHIKEILDTVQREVNGRLPAYSRLARIVERPEPFVKTATHKIKRFLYTR